MYQQVTFLDDPGPGVINPLEGWRLSWGNPRGFMVYMTYMSYMWPCLTPCCEYRVSSFLHSYARMHIEHLAFGKRSGLRGVTGLSLVFLGQRYILGYRRSLSCHKSPANIKQTTNYIYSLSRGIASHHLPTKKETKAVPNHGQNGQWVCSWFLRRNRWRSWFNWLSILSGPWRPLSTNLEEESFSAEGWWSWEGVGWLVCGIPYVMHSVVKDEIDNFENQTLVISWMIFEYY